MSPESFTDRLREALGSRLTMVALYGSAAVGDASEGYSDVNLMVVCSELGLEELDAIGPLSKDWARLGNPPPLLFEHERLMNSSHVFPIELLDIKENHRVLWGPDLLRALPISQSNLRFQLEHELKGKLIQLRESFLLSPNEERAILELMLQSLSAFQIMLKGALRFYEVSVPARKRDAVKHLARHVFFDLSVFEELQAIKDGESPEGLSLEQARSLLDRYLEAIERSADLMGQLGRR